MSQSGFFQFMKRLFLGGYASGSSPQVEPYDSDPDGQVGKLMSIDTLNKRRQRQLPPSSSPDDIDYSKENDGRGDYDPIEIASNDMVCLTRQATQDEVAAFEIANKLHTIQVVCVTFLSGGVILFAGTIAIFVML